MAVIPDWTCSVHQPDVYPSLPQAKNGVLDLSLLDDTGADIIVSVPRWGNIAEEDWIIAYFDNIPSIKVPIEDANKPSYDVPFHTSDIPNGDYLVWYAMHKPIGNCSRSLVLPVTVIGSKNETFAGPIFPDAVDGVLSYQTVAGKNGTLIRTNYPTIAVGDAVIFYWSGFNAEDDPMPSATYVSQSYTANETDFKNGYVQGFIPGDNVLAVGSDGYGVAYYQVKAGGKTSSSLNTQVMLSLAEITQLQITSTSGASSPDNELPYLHPYNHVSVFGPPGASITASVSEGGAIHEAQGKTSYSTSLNQNGIAHFRVSSQKASQVAVNAYPLPLTGIPPHTTMDFYAYREGSAGIDAYAYTTGAPNDNRSPCTLYLVVNTAFRKQKLHVEVTSGSALINGLLQQTDIPPNDDGSVSLDIVSKVVEQVQITAYVPNQPGPPVTIPLEFIQFPVR